MIALIEHNFILLAVAVSIGVVTGWLIFGRRPAVPQPPEEPGPA